MRRYIWLLVIIVAGLMQQVLMSETFAQVEQATLTGTITDNAGGKVRDAKVTITNVNTQVVRETKTTSDGHYTVPYLPAGQYEITVETQGFKKAQVKAITLTVGLTATVDISLEPGVVTDAVDVTAGATQLESQSGSLGNVVVNEQLRELPLLNRNPFGLATLAPGVIAAGNTGTGRLSMAVGPIPARYCSTEPSFVTALPWT